MVNEMDDHEKDNISATLIASLDSVFQEKLRDEAWQAKLKGLSTKVNIAVISSQPGDLDRAHVSIIIDNGSITVQPGALPDADFELAATFETFFTIATGALGSVKALLGGKLKVKRGGRNASKLLLLSKLLVLS